MKECIDVDPRVKFCHKFGMINCFKRLNYFNLGLALFIILWGAWVRLSGSGAGCGDHWPLCNGQVVPLEPSVKTLIEYIHRLSSGIFGITIFASLILAIKLTSKGHFARVAGWSSLIFTITEALIGAILVKKGLVVDNDSTLRAWVIGFHLVNTFILLSALVAQIYFVPEKKYEKNYSSHKFLYISTAGVIVFLLVGATGAISALGNTLFPETSLIEGVLKDFDQKSHFLIRLRIFHPALAILLFGLIQWVVSFKKSKINRVLVFCSWVAVGFGVLNWALLAPKWGAITHLLIADALWCIFILSIFSYIFPRATK